MTKKFGIAVKAIIKKDGKYLVLFKSENEDINPNEIDIPGGRIEFGENAEDCLIREIQEEVNLGIEIEKPSKVWHIMKDDLHLVGITFLANYLSGEIKLSGEHNKYKWLSKNQIINSNYPEWIKKEFKDL